jgi:hypothetical protein
MHICTLGSSSSYLLRVLHVGRVWCVHHNVGLCITTSSHVCKVCLRVALSNSVRQQVAKVEQHQSSQVVQSSKLCHEGSFKVLRGAFPGRVA